MTRYYVQPRDRTFVKGYGFFSFAKNMDKNLGKSRSKTLSGKYIQNLLDRTIQSATGALKLVLKEQFKKEQKQLVI